MIWSKSRAGAARTPFAEDDGGFGAGAVETMIVMEALAGAGAGAVSRPVVIGGASCVTAARRSRRRRHSGIIEGAKTFAFAPA